MGQLQDDLTNMYNEIGTSLQDFFKKAIETGSFLVDNYKKIGEALGVMVIAYGTYKTALLVAKALEKARAVWTTAYIGAARQQILMNAGLTSSEIKKAAAITATNTVMQAQLATMSKMLFNPYVLAAAGVAALAYLIYKVATAQSYAESVQERYNKKLEEQKELKDKIVNTTNDYIGIIKDETTTIYQQIEALDKLKREYPELFASMTLADVKKMPLDDLNKQINEYADTEKIRKAEEDYRNAAAALEEWQKRISASLGNTSAGGMGMYKELADAKIEADAALKVLVEMQRIMRDAEWESKSDKEKIAALEQEKALLEEQRRQIEAQIPAINQLDGKFDNLQNLVTGSTAEWGKFDLATQLHIVELNNVNEQLNQIKGRINAINSASEGNVGYGQAFREAKKEYEEAKAALEAFKKLQNSDDKIVTAQAYKDASNRFKIAKENYEDLGGVIKTSTKNSGADAKKEQKRINDEMLQMQRDVITERIRLMDEGSKKEIETAINNFDNEIAELEKKVQAWKDAQKGVLTQDQTQVYDAAYQSSFDTMIKSINDASKKQQDADKEALDKLLDQYADFNYQRINLEKQFQEDIKKLEAGRTTDNSEQIDATIAQRSKDYAEGLKQISDKEFKQMASNSKMFERLFGDAAEMTNAQIKAVIAEAKKLLEETQFLQGQTPENIKAIYDAIIEKQNELDSRTSYPFAGIIKGFQNLKKAAAEYEKQFKEGLSQSEQDAAVAAGNAYKAKGLEYIKEGAVEATDAFTSLAASIQEIGKEIGDVGLEEFGDNLSQMASSTSNIVKGWQSGGWIGAIVGIATSALDATKKQIVESAKMQKAATDSAKNYENEYMKTLIERNYLEENYKSALTNDTIARTQGAYKAAQEAMQAYNAALSKEIELTEDASYVRKDFLNPLDHYTEGLDSTLNQMGLGVIRKFGDEAAKILGKIDPISMMFGIGQTTTNKMDVIEKALEQGMTALQAELVQVQKKTWWKIGSKDKYSTLFELNPDLWGGKIDGEFDVEAARVFLDTNEQISDELREQIENVIELHETYTEAVDAIKEEVNNMFGNLADDFTDALFDSVRNGADAWALFEDSGLAVIDNLGKQLIKEMFFNSYLKGFEQRAIDAYGLGSASETQSALMGIMTDIISGMGSVVEGATEAAKLWDESAEKQGWDISKLANAAEETARTGSKGLAASMTQDQATEMNGFLNNGLIFWRDIAGNTSAIYQYLTENNVGTNNTAFGAATQNMVSHLQAINENTFYCRRLERIESLMSNVSAGIDDIKTRGIVVRV